MKVPVSVHLYLSDRPDLQTCCYSQKCQTRSQTSLSSPSSKSMVSSPTGMGGAAQKLMLVISRCSRVMSGSVRGVLPAWLPIGSCWNLHSRLESAPIHDPFLVRKNTLSMPTRVSLQIVMQRQSLICCSICKVNDQLPVGCSKYLFTYYLINA